MIKLSLKFLFIFNLIFLTIKTQDDDKEIKKSCKVHLKENDCIDADGCCFNKLKLYDRDLYYCQSKKDLIGYVNNYYLINQPSNNKEKANKVADYDKKICCGDISKLFYKN